MQIELHKQEMEMFNLKKILFSKLFLRFFQNPQD